MSLSTRVNGVETLLGESVRHITDAELEYLRTAIGVSTEESVMAPPWKAMLTSKAVWAIIIAHFAENWGFYTLLTGLPMFMRGKSILQCSNLMQFPSEYYRIRMTHHIVLLLLLISN